MMLRRLILSCPFILTAVGMVSCGVNGKLPGSLDEGQYYMTGYKGTEYFFCLDELSDKESSGRYYVNGDDAYAPACGFTAEFGRRKVKLESGGESVRIPLAKLSVSQYAEPEFIEAGTSLYRKPSFEVMEHPDVVFGNVEGYWTSLPGVEAEVSKVFTSGYVRSFGKRDLELAMDVYEPDGIDGKKPLILFIHGGAFYVGDKKEPAYVDFCRSFSSMGYVTASINYRMGFHVGKGEIERAGYVALQDAHAAMRWLVSHSEEYGIDTDRIYVAGSSAGGITALNLAFMTEKDRPKSSYGGKGLFNGSDLGRIDRSGNDLKEKFDIKGVASMWGAVSSTDILENAGTSLILFHGDADNVVPYAEGYPFSSAGKIISQGLSEKMYGSACIDSVARSIGLNSVFYSIPGEGHALNTTGKDKQPNGYHTLIKGHMQDFFFKEMVGQEAALVSDRPGLYSVSGNVRSVSWKAEGGFILSSSKNGVRVLWREDAPVHRITASGNYANGAGYLESLTL